MPLTTTHLEESFTSSEEGIQRLLGSILNLNIHQESSEKCITNVINRLISTAKHRKQGLEYLNLLIDSCSASAIGDYALNWVNHCIIKFPDDVLRELKLRTLAKIVEAAHNESDFNKRFVSEYISKVLDNCLTTSSINPFECKAALELLVVCMQYYPSWFGPHRQKIEGFVTVHFDSRDEQITQVASLAFHYLQQTGGAGTNGTNHKQNFTNSFHKLCKTLHNLYDKFFERERELFQADIPDCDSFEFQDDPGWNSQKVLEITAQRIKNVFKFLETMIRIKYPVAKETKPKRLLDVITRGTALHKCISGDKEYSLIVYQFSLLLLELQAYSLKLLRLTIIWYQSICLPFSYIISKTIVESIQRSHNCDCYKLDSLYQESAYKALSEWIAVTKSSLHPQFQAQVLECILEDITPVKSRVTLTISEAVAGKKSQKAKRKAMADIIINSGQNSKTESSNLFEKSVEVTTCKFALAALRSLLECANLNIKTELLKDLYKSVFTSLINLQTGRTQHPYTDDECQAKLYEVLAALYDQTTVAVLPPLQTTIEILNRGMNGNNVSIRDTCQRGLRLIESICQPVCPSMYLGVEREEREENVRGVEKEFIVLEEIPCDVDKGSDVDYDADTIDLNHDNDQNGYSYRVNLPKDQSTINDGQSEKDCRLEDLEFEELGSMTSIRSEDVDVDVDRVIVVTPGGNIDVNVNLNASRDGIKHAVSLETIVEQVEEFLEDKNESETLSEANQNKDSPIEPFYSAQTPSPTNNPDEIEPNTEIRFDYEDSEPFEVQPEDSPNETATKRPRNEEEETTVIDLEDEVSETFEVKPEDSPNETATKRPRNEEEVTTVIDLEESPKSPDQLSEEPDVKKPKIVEDAKDVNENPKSPESEPKIGESVVEVENGDPDESYLEDDSFVDEVKDYYQ